METAALTHTKVFHWRTLLTLSALGNLAVLAYMGLAQADTLAMILGLIIITGLALTRLRTRLPGAILLGLIFADITVWTVSGAVNNWSHGDRGLAVLLPSFLGILSLTGLLAAVGSVVTRRGSFGYSRLAAMAGAGSLVLLLTAATASFVRQAPGAPAAANPEIVLGSKNMVFSSAGLTARSGEITLTLSNDDLWWHTFTIDELGIDLQVPMAAERTVTFDAPPGEYRYYCAIPGHEAIGMHGTLVVEE